MEEIQSIKLSEIKRNILDYNEKIEMLRRAL